jgi:hypothetical protein
MRRRHRPRTETIRRCPMCHSPEILTDVTIFTGALYTCKRCGYRGPLILEEDVPSSGGPPPEGS